MLLRKTNAVISLVITAFLMNHAINMAAWMLSKGEIAQQASVFPWILFFLMLAHVFIIIDNIVSGISDGKHKNCKNYPQLNRTMLLQRISGVLMVVFTGLHIAGATGVMQPPQIVHAIVPPLFFALCMVHVAFSVSKAFVTLGIGNAKFVKAVDIAVKAICIVTLIADITGFYLYVV